MVYRGSRAISNPFAVSVFLADLFAELLSYVTTSAQLALAFPDPAGGFMVSFYKFVGIFAVTQIPLAICEGILSVVVMNALVKFNQEEMGNLESVHVKEAEA